MIGFAAGVRIVVAMRPVDFWRGAESLAALAREVLQEDPYKGVIVIFRPRRANRVKIVTWDQSGLVMMWKALDGAKFQWPPVVDGCMRLSAAQAAALLEGLEWRRIYRATLHRRRPHVEQSPDRARERSGTACYFVLENSRMMPSDTSIPNTGSAVLAGQNQAVETARLAEEIALLIQQTHRLAEEKAELAAVVVQMTALIAAKDTLVDKLTQAVKDLRALKFGRRSEKLAPGQLALAFEDLALAAASIQAQIERIEDEAAKLSGGEEALKQRKSRRRRDPDEPRASLPPHLPVVEDVIEPDSLECSCCGSPLHRIGETSASRLDVVPV